ncbi:hypothetical protein [Streptomyces chartreusis]|uniref:hypothetical protein n=1 Tax=Streptomyces chartreusis TaxID=1969 RepID=UPI003801B159
MRDRREIGTGPEDWGTGFDAALDAYPNWEPGRLHAVDRGNAELLDPLPVRTPVT